MIASSTSAPMAIAMPPSVMVLIDAPKARSIEDGRGERQRHRRQRDGGGAQVRQKDQHDDDDEDAAVAQRLDDVVDRDLDEVGLAEDLAVDGHARRQFLLERVELAVEPRGQLDRVGAGLLLDADDDRRLAAARTFAALERAALRARRRRRAPAPERSPRNATTLSPISSGLRTRPTACSTYSCGPST